MRAEPGRRGLRRGRVAGGVVICIAFLGMAQVGASAGARQPVGAAAAPVGPFLPAVITLLAAPTRVPELPAAPAPRGPGAGVDEPTSRDHDLPDVASRSAGRSVLPPVGRPTPTPAAATPTPTPAAEVRGASTLEQAVDRLPGYRPGSVRWVSRAYAGHWGAADWTAGVVYISPRVPPDRLYSVVAHEWSHMLQFRAYDGDVAAAMRAMNRYFGGSGKTGAERAADCMTRLLGGWWTHYTSCEQADWRRGADLLLRGRQL